MKKKLPAAFLCLSVLLLTQTENKAQNSTGPSSSQSPYLKPAVPNAGFTSILTAGDVVNGYKMVGTPDGLGAFDNGDGTFTLLVNHEFGNTAGVVRAHGSAGALVSKWVINKSTLAVVSGSDLIKNVKLWNGSGYTTYNANNPSSLAALGRFCSADLPPVSAFYNSATGLGTLERIFMNGEETGNEGRGFGHIVTGTNAGTTYELPNLGKFSWENSVASPTPSDKTVVAGLDDATPGQVYFYIGTKTNSGTEIEKAGLSNGKLYGVAVTGLVTETSASVPSANTPFQLVDLGTVQNTTGADLNTASNTAGVTTFLRPEDGAWDPSNLNDFYFATTNAFASPSRLWKLHFTDPTHPELGGTITAVLDGTEGQKMLDNLTIDQFGHILLVEDVGGNAHLGKVWQYTIATDLLKQIGTHDSTRFITGGANFLTQDEEASGIIDAQDILGKGKFLLVDQTHYPIAGELVEGGQLLTYFNPDTFNANSAPTVKITAPANNAAYIKGDIVTITATAKDTDGTVAKVEFYINNVKVGHDSMAPYQFNWTSVKGAASLKAIAYDNLGKEGQSSVVTITVNDYDCANAGLIINAGNNQNVKRGYAPLECATLPATITGGTPPYNILWSTGATTSTIKVCPTKSATYSVVVTDVRGCTAIDNVNICVENVKCGFDAVYICWTYTYHQTAIAKLTFCTSPIIAQLLTTYFNTATTTWSVGTCSNATCNSPALSSTAESGDFGSNQYLTAEEYALLYGTAPFNLYPNPASDVSLVTLEMKNVVGETVQVTVQDILGKVIFNKPVAVSNDHAIATQLNFGYTLPRGSYIVRVTTNTTVVTHKLIIQ